MPADFPGGGIASVSGILMAQADQVRGSPLSGVAAKMTDGLFVIGLSALDLDLQLNEQLLKDRSWVYIPIGYTNGGRAILAMEKGPPGDGAFAEVLCRQGKEMTKDPREARLWEWFCRRWRNEDGDSRRCCYVRLDQYCVSKSAG